MELNMHDDLIWDHQDPSGIKMQLAYKEGTVTLRRDGVVTDWPVASFFEAYAPCSDFPFAMQNEIMLSLASKMMEHPDQRIRINPIVRFWLAYPSLSIKPQEFHYETKVSKAYRWQLRLDHAGITYIDLDDDYGQGQQAYHQTLADFWFYGPLYPVPDPVIRKTLINTLRDSLLKAGFNLPESHFGILDYPSFAHFAQWADGDHIVSDFVIMRDYGIEWGRQNFHDGLVFLGFLSYEQCLTRPSLDHWIMKKEILHTIRNEITGIL
jgi:hypothetical protein